MKKQYSFSSFSIIHIFFLIILTVTITSSVEAQSCDPSGNITGIKPPEECNTENNSECCEEGTNYTTYECSPPVSDRTTATLTLNSFEEGGDGGHEWKCDGKYHPNDTPVVALSTGWFDNKSRCSKKITIYGNMKSAEAIVVDECDSTMGCDDPHSYQPPCHNNIVDASKAVWEALEVPGELEIEWSDA